MDSNTVRSESLVSSNRSETPENQSDSSVIPKRRCRMQDVLVAKKQMDEAFALIKERSKNTKAVSECDLYGQLLAEKLKSLQEDHRLILMNEIDNLIFSYTMKIRKEIRSPITYSDQLPIPVNQHSIYVPRSSQSEQSSVTPQEYVLPGSSTRQYPAASNDFILRSQSIKKYDIQSTPMPYERDIRIQTEIHEIPGRSFDSQTVSQQPNYITNTSIACDYDNNIASFSMNSLNQEPEVPTNKKINIISETTIRPKNNKDIIQEAYERCGGTDISDDDEHYHLDDY